MRNVLSVLVVLFLFGSLVSHSEDQLVSSKGTMLVPSSKPKLNSEKKKNLAGSVDSIAFSGSVNLPKDILLTVISRKTFTIQIDMQKRATDTRSGELQRVKRTVTAAFVQVATGPQRGTKGWVVVSHQDKGKNKYTHLRKPYGTKSTDAVAAKGAAPDFSASVSRGDSRRQVAGKEVFSVSIANEGAKFKGVFSVEVTVNGKKIKTEKVRNLKSRGSHYFNVEVSESAVRKHHTMMIYVDKGNKVAESDESNNTYKIRL